MDKKVINDRIVAAEIFGAAACNIACHYCKRGNTKILMADFTLKEIKDVKIGDKVIGFDIPKKHKHFKAIITEVLNVQKRRDVLYKITLENGNYVELTNNHAILSKFKRWHVIDNSIPNEVNTQNKLMIGQSMKSLHSSNIETIEYNDEFKMGYLKGMIDGDGNVRYGKFNSKNTGKEYINYIIKIFQALHNYKAIERLEEYLNHLKIYYNKNERDGGFYITLNRKDDVKYFIDYENSSRSYKAGWLSGIFDAEGSIDKHNLSIGQYYDINRPTYDKIINYLEFFNFEHSPIKWKNKIKGIRLRGGSSELIRFLDMFKPALKRKFKSIYNRNLSGSSKVKSIEKQGEDFVYNIQTGTENYIANGFVSHNCYIPKNKKLDPIHADIIEKLKTGKFMKTLKEVYGETLEHLGSWGTEPTLTLPHYIPIFDKILTDFPKLKSFSFSSNFMTNSKILVDLINKVNDNIDDREFELKFQISLDGPPEITDTNRKKGGERLILNNLHKFFKLVNEIKIKDNLVINLTWKPTWSIDNFRDFHKNPSKLWGFFHYFDEIVDLLINENKNKKVKLMEAAIPTLVVPGKYTKDDGILYFEVMKEIYKIQHENDKRKIFKHYNGVLDSYYYRLKRLFNYERELHNKPGMFTCSGGKSNLGIDVFGDIHLCHRTFYSKYEEYNKQVVLDGKDLNEIENIKKNKIKNANDKYVVNKDNTAEIARLEYIFSSYHDYTKFKMGATITNIYELAYSGLILKKYGEYENAYLMALLINTGLSCPADNIMYSGNIHISNSSLYKMFGNGALDLILEEMRRRNDL